MWTGSPVRASVRVGPLRRPYVARMASGALMRMSPIWFSAAVRALTAERAALCRARMPATVSSLGAGLGASGQGGACGCVGVDGVGLADAAAFGPVGPVDLHDVTARRAGGAGEAGPVGGGALHSDRDHVAVRGHEGQSSGVTGCGGAELGVREVTAVAADHSDVKRVGMGVDPAEHSVADGVRFDC